MEIELTTTQDLESSVREILANFDNPERDGLKDTPRRYLNFLTEFLNPDDFKLSTFDAEGYDQMIIQTNIPFYSLCEHHLAPFFGVGHIAYLPHKKQIVGLSKLARVLDMFARRLQNQERITKQIAEYLTEELDPKGIAVMLKAQHLCMAMRGIKKHDTWTITSEMSGVFRDNPSAKAEFLHLIKP
ncbi:MAG TPA: GTP cyclohydrolase I FolE [Pyrinomonadaceae bacterium]|nr:GTP cyclohydrolase I FolE [Pyrinomonadaceae bacterium]